MPVTKTARRALRGSLNKQKVNKALVSKLEAAVRIAKKSKKEKDIQVAIGLTDRAAKKKIIHKNKAARNKRSLSKLMPPKKNVKNKTAKSKKTGGTKSKK